MMNALGRRRLRDRLAASWIAAGLALVALFGVVLRPAEAANVGSTLVLDANDGRVLMARDADARAFPPR